MPEFYAQISNLLVLWVCDEGDSLLVIRCSGHLELITWDPFIMATVTYVQSWCNLMSQSEWLLQIFSSVEVVWLFSFCSNVLLFRLEQDILLGGRIGGERRLLQRRGPHELWHRGRSCEEAGELGGEYLGLLLFVVSYSFSCKYSGVSLFFFPDCPGSRKVHGGGRLREGGSSGAVCQEWRRGPADQRRRGGTMVNIFKKYLMTEFCVRLIPSAADVDTGLCLGPVILECFRHLVPTYEQFV